MLFECFKILLIWIKHVSKLVSHKGVFKTIVLSFLSLIVSVYIHTINICKHNKPNFLFKTLYQASMLIYLYVILIL